MAKEIGKIGWIDLTVPDATSVRDFYQSVIGWQHEDVPMKDGQDEYADYNIKEPVGGEVVTGVCHARGYNARMPPAWMIYVTVENAEASAKACVAAGGEIVDGPKSFGKSKMAVLRDPAGAVFAVMD